MDSQQFIDWLTKKLEEYGVKKVVPAPDVLESVYRLAILNQKTNEAIARVQANLHHSTRTQKLKSLVRGSMDTMTLNGHHNTDDIRAQLAEICDQFREGLLAMVVPLCASQQALPLDEETEENSGKARSNNSVMCS